MEEAENSENLIEIAMDAESAKAIEVAACDGLVIYSITSRNFGLLKNKSISVSVKSISFLNFYNNQTNNNS